MEAVDAGYAPATNLEGAGMVKILDGKKKTPNPRMMAYLMGRGAATTDCPVSECPYKSDQEPLRTAFCDGYRHQKGLAPGAKL